MSGSQQVSGKRRVYSLLRCTDTLSRALLAQKTGLTRPAVSAIVAEFEAMGIVRETGRGDSTGGKPPILLELAPASRFAVGLEAGDDYLVRGVLSDIAGNVTATGEQEYENRFESIADSCIVLARKLLKQAHGGTVCGIGTAVSGVVDSVRNVVASSATLDIVGKPLAQKLSDALGLPVLLENRPNAAAFAESLFGAGREYGDLIFITSGRGVGAGIVIGGTLFRGHFGMAGEIGQLRINGGVRLEDAVRPSVLTAAFSAAKKKTCSFQDLLKFWESGDPDAEKLVLANAEMMAYAAEAAARMFDPEAVIFGGRILDFGDRYLQHLEESFRAGGVTAGVVKSRFGVRGAAVGGAQAVLDGII